MSYILDLAQREALLAASNLAKDQVYISLTRKSFRSDGGKMSVLFEDGIKDAQILEALLYHQIKHIVQNSFQPADQKLALIKILSANQSRFFEVDFNLLPEGSLQSMFHFNYQTQRDELINNVCQFAGLDPGSSRALRAIQSLEELVMNAQVNAPGAGPKDPNMMCFLKAELHDNLIAFSVIDPYGTLDVKKFLKKIEATQALGVGEAMNFGRGGAGIGSTLIFQNSDSIFLGVKPGLRTRVSVIMPYMVNDRKFEGLQKTIHIFNS